MSTSLGQVANTLRVPQIGNFLNLGIDVGVGGDRPHHVGPMIYGKVGPFYGNYTALFDSYFSFGFNVGVDILEINKGNSKHYTCITFSGGLADFASLKDNKVSYDFISVMAGFNRYFKNNRAKVSFKVGGIDHIKYTELGTVTNRYGSSYTDYSYESTVSPYADLSISYSLAKFSKSPPTLLKPFIEGFDSSFISNVFFIKRKKVNHKYFNPYVSFGFGRDRLEFYPTVGVQSGRFFVDGIFLGGGSRKRWNFGFGANLNKIEIRGVSLVPNVAIQRNCFLNDNSTGIWNQNTNRYTYDRKVDGYSETTLVGGLSIAPKNLSTSLRLQLGVGEYSAFNFGETDGQEWSNNTIKIRPVAGVSLVIKMFKTDN